MLNKRSNSCYQATKIPSYQAEEQQDEMDEVEDMVEAGEEGRKEGVQEAEHCWLRRFGEK